MIYNVLYFRNMETNLVPPIMMFLEGLDVDECPKFLSRKPTESNHSVYLLMSGIKIPSQLEGMI